MNNSTTNSKNKEWNKRNKTNNSKAVDLMKKRTKTSDNIGNKKTGTNSNGR